MKQSEISVGQIVCIGRLHGKELMATERRARVIRKGQKMKPWSERIDAVLIQPLDENGNPEQYEDNQWNREHGHVGNREVKYRTRELMSVAEADRLLQAQREAEAERQRRAQAVVDLREHVESSLREAFDTGDEASNISVRVRFNLELDTAVVEEITFSGDAIDGLMTYSNGKA